jgi:hypothetical protein
MRAIRLKIGNGEPADIFHVAQAMRDADYAEFTALSSTNSREELATELCDRLSFRPETIVAGLDEPICVGVPFPIRPNVVSLLFFATDRFHEIGLPITRFIVRELFPKLKAAGVHRLETLAMADNQPGRAWLRTLGLKAETGPLRGYGRNGEEFVQYSWVRE